MAAYIRALQFSQSANQFEVPSGVQVENLKDIAERQGLPESFAQPWSLPATAVSALPPEADVSRWNETLEKMPRV